MDNDVLNTIDPCISSTLATTRTATVELLTIIVDFNPQIFREFLLKQSRRIPETKNVNIFTKINNNFVFISVNIAYQQINNSHAQRRRF
jgi:hypothetical protein